MQIFTLLVSIAMAAIVSAQDYGCNDDKLGSCYATAYPTDILNGGECKVQECLCNAMSMQANCWVKHCTASMSSEAFGDFSACKAGATTGVGLINTSLPTPAITSAGGSGPTTADTAAANTATSTRSAGGAEGLHQVAPVGGFLAVFLGVLANL